MIGRMKKVTVICTRDHREASLLALQGMGVLHLEHIREPAGSWLEEARKRFNEMQTAVETLVHAAAEVPPSMAASKTRGAESVVDEVGELARRRKDHAESLEHWRHECARMAPFGSFDPAAIAELAHSGLHVQLYKFLSKKEIEVPEDAVCTVHHRDKSGTYFSVVSREPLSLPYEPVRLPDHSLEKMQAKAAELERSIAQAAADLARLVAHLPEVRELADHAEDRMRFLEAREGMGATEPVAYLRGYCPERDVDRIREAAAEQGWGVLIEDVEPTDRVPTKIENPGWVKPIRTVFGFIGVVPGYDEVDISAVFLLFFSLFFAMIVGDAGYGALFLGATFWAQRKFKKAPASVFHLLYITSIATIVWGALTGNYFGIAGMPAIFQAVKIGWLTETENIMLLCFTIGAAHLTIAHGWNVARRIRSLQALAQVGWICIVWTMYFLARFLVLNQDFPSIMMPIFAVGIVLLVLFMTPVRRIKTEWFSHVMLPLNLVSNFVDVVSYVRLFAVGTATLAVASAFNGMAIDVGAGSWVGGVFAVVIIFMGHALNILLAAMGVLVHGIRLNTLEFAGHLGLQWTGIRFSPFMQKSGRSPLTLDDKTSDMARKPE